MERKRKNEVTKKITVFVFLFIYFFSSFGQAVFAQINLGFGSSVKRKFNNVSEMYNYTATLSPQDQFEFLNSSSVVCTKDGEKVFDSDNGTAYRFLCFANNLAGVNLQLSLTILNSAKGFDFIGYTASDESTIRYDGQNNFDLKFTIFNNSRTVFSLLVSSQNVVGLDANTNEGKIIFVNDVNEFKDFLQSLHTIESVLFLKNAYKQIFGTDAVASYSAANVQGDNSSSSALSSLSSSEIFGLVHGQNIQKDFANSAYLISFDNQNKKIVAQSNGQNVGNADISLSFVSSPALQILNNTNTTIFAHAILGNNSLSGQASKVITLQNVADSVSNNVKNFFGNIFGTEVKAQGTILNQNFKFKVVYFPLKKGTMQNGALTNAEYGEPVVEEFNNLQDAIDFYINSIKADLQKNNLPLIENKGYLLLDKANGEVTFLDLGQYAVRTQWSAGTIAPLEQILYQQNNLAKYLINQEIFGDFHTHPLAGPEASVFDVQGWSQQKVNDIYTTDPTYHVIYSYSQGTRSIIAFNNEDASELNQQFKAKNFGFFSDEKDAPDVTTALHYITDDEFQKDLSSTIESSNQQASLPAGFQIIPVSQVDPIKLYNLVYQAQGELLQQDNLPSSLSDMQKQQVISEIFGNKYSLVATDNSGNPIGYSRITILSDGTALLTERYVLPAYRSGGVGTALFEQTYSALRQDGVTVFRASVVDYSGNGPIISLLTSQGFQFVRRVPGFLIYELRIPSNQNPSGTKLAATGTTSISYASQSDLFSGKAKIKDIVAINDNGIIIPGYIVSYDANTRQVTIISLEKTVTVGFDQILENPQAFLDTTDQLTSDQITEAANMATNNNQVSQFLDQTTTYTDTISKGFRALQNLLSSAKSRGGQLSNFYYDLGPYAEVLDAVSWSNQAYKVIKSGKEAVENGAAIGYEPDIGSIYLRVVSTTNQPGTTRELIYSAILLKQLGYKIVSDIHSHPPNNPNTPMEYYMLPSADDFVTSFNRQSDNRKWIQVETTDMSTGDALIISYYFDGDALQKSGYLQALQASVTAARNAEDEATRRGVDKTQILSRDVYMKPVYDMVKNGFVTPHVERFSPDLKTIIENDVSMQQRIKSFVNVGVSGNGINGVSNQGTMLDGAALQLEQIQVAENGIVEVDIAPKTPAQISTAPLELGAEVNVPVSKQTAIQLLDSAASEEAQRGVTPVLDQYTKTYTGQIFLKYADQIHSLNLPSDQEIAALVKLERFYMPNYFTEMVRQYVGRVPGFDSKSQVISLTDLRDAGGISQVESNIGSCICGDANTFLRDLLNRYGIDSLAVRGTFNGVDHLMAYSQGILIDGTPDSPGGMHAPMTNLADGLDYSTAYAALSENPKLEQIYKSFNSELITAEQNYLKQIGNLKTRTYAKGIYTKELQKALALRQNDGQAIEDSLKEAFDSDLQNIGSVQLEVQSVSVSKLTETNSNLNGGELSEHLQWDLSDLNNGASVNFKVVTADPRAFTAERTVATNIPEVGSITFDPTLFSEVPTIEVFGTRELPNVPKSTAQSVLEQLKTASSFSDANSVVQQQYGVSLTQDQYSAIKSAMPSLSDEILGDVAQRIVFDVNAGISPDIAISENVRVEALSLQHQGGLGLITGCIVCGKGNSWNMKTTQVKYLSRSDLTNGVAIGANDYVAIKQNNGYVAARVTDYNPSTRYMTFEQGGEVRTLPVDYASRTPLEKLSVQPQVEASSGIKDIQGTVGISVTKTPEVVAIGDLHGEYNSFVKILQDARLIDSDLNWIGGDRILVVIGDFVDRGPNAKGIMDLMMKLQSQAPVGKVNALLGDHELFMLEGDYRYVVNNNGFGSFSEMQSAFSEQGIYGQWLRGLPTAIKSGDILFVHAGISTQWADFIHSNGIGSLNRLVNNAIKAGDWSNPVFAVGAARGSKGIGGPFWLDSGDYYQSGLLNYYDPASSAKYNSIVSDIVNKIGVSRIVFGHTVQEQIGGEKLIGIDTGISEHYGGKLSYLEINANGEIRAVYPSKTGGISSFEILKRGFQPSLVKIQPQPQPRLSLTDEIVKMQQLKLQRVQQIPTSETATGEIRALSAENALKNYAAISSAETGGFSSVTVNPDGTVSVTIGEGETATNVNIEQTASGTTAKATAAGASASASTAGVAPEVVQDVASSAFSGTAGTAVDFGAFTANIGIFKGQPGATNVNAYKFSSTTDLSGNVVSVEASVSRNNVIAGSMELNFDPATGKVTSTKISDPENFFGAENFLGMDINEARSTFRSLATDVIQADMGAALKSPNEILAVGEQENGVVAFQKVSGGKVSTYNPETQSFVSESGIGVGRIIGLAFDAIAIAGFGIQLAQVATGHMPIGFSTPQEFQNSVSLGVGASFAAIGIADLVGISALGAVGGPVSIALAAGSVVAIEAAPFAFANYQLNPSSLGLVSPTGMNIAQQTFANLQYSFNGQSSILASGGDAIFNQVYAQEYSNEANHVGGMITKTIPGHYVPIGKRLIYVGPSTTSNQASLQTDSFVSAEIKYLGTPVSTTDVYTGIGRYLVKIQKTTYVGDLLTKLDATTNSDEASKLSQQITDALSKAGIHVTQIQITLNSAKRLQTQINQNNALIGQYKTITPIPGARSATNVGYAIFALTQENQQLTNQHNAKIISVGTPTNLVLDGQPVKLLFNSKTGNYYTNAGNLALTFDSKTGLYTDSAGNNYAGIGNPSLASIDLSSSNPLRINQVIVIDSVTYTKVGAYTFQGINKGNIVTLSFDVTGRLISQTTTFSDHSSEVSTFSNGVTTDTFDDPSHAVVSVIRTWTTPTGGSVTQYLNSEGLTVQTRITTTVTVGGVTIQVTDVKDASGNLIGVIEVSKITNSVGQTVTITTVKNSAGKPVQSSEYNEQTQVTNVYSIDSNGQKTLIETIAAPDSNGFSEVRNGKGSLQGYQKTITLPTGGTQTTTYDTLCKCASGIISVTRVTLSGSTTYNYLTDAYGKHRIVSSVTSSLDDQVTTIGFGPDGSTVTKTVTIPGGLNSYSNKLSGVSTLGFGGTFEVCSGCGNLNFNPNGHFTFTSGGTTLGGYTGDGFTLVENADGSYKFCVGRDCVDCGKECSSYRINQLIKSLFSKGWTCPCDDNGVPTNPPKTTTAHKATPLPGNHRGQKGNPGPASGSSPPSPFGRRGRFVIPSSTIPSNPLTDFLNNLYSQFLQLFNFNQTPNTTQAATTTWTNEQIIQQINGNQPTIMPFNFNQ